MRWRGSYGISGNRGVSAFTNSSRSWPRARSRPAARAPQLHARARVERRTLRHGALDLQQRVAPKSRFIGKKLKDLKLDPEFLKEDPEFVSEAILQAIVDASEKAKKRNEQKNVTKRSTRDRENGFDN